eukprot:11292517-Alexandrium_andersonii.AAC.1
MYGHTRDRQQRHSRRRTDAEQTDVRRRTDTEQTRADTGHTHTHNKYGTGMGVRQSGRRQGAQSKQE